MAIKFYWDACVCVDWIQNTDPVKREMLRPIMDACTAGDVLIVVSALVLAEVVRANGDQPMSDAEDAEIRMFFLHPNIEVRPLDSKISHIARDIMRARLALKAGNNNAYKKIPLHDAIHIATAMETGCDCLHSFDADDMHVENGKHKIPGMAEGLKISAPSYAPSKPLKPATGQKGLFDETGSLDSDVVEAAKQKVHPASKESLGHAIENEVLAEKASKSGAAGIQHTSGDIEITYPNGPNGAMEGKVVDGEDKTEQAG